MKSLSLKVLRVCWVLVLLWGCGSGLLVGQTNEGILSVSSPGSVERQVEALGTRAGVWGRLSDGLEAWVYPFKAFDRVRFGWVDPSGRFESIAGSVRQQTVRPTETELVFGDSENSWALRWQFTVPRGHPGGWVRVRGSAPPGCTPAIRLRPVLVPMHLPIEVGMTSRWDADSGTLWFREHGRGVWLGMRGKGTERAAGVSNAVTVPVGLNDSRGFWFALGSGERSEVAGWLDALDGRRGEIREASDRYYRELVARLPRVVTPDGRVNSALTWAGVALDQLRVENPDLGWGLVSGYSGSGDSTRPKYCWYFEEPTLTSWAYHRLGMSQYIRESLDFLARYRREDGKTVHEVTQSLAHWPEFLAEFRYAYMHTDGPVYYLVAYGHYLRSTGEVDWIRSHWDGIRSIYQWCLSRVDARDGLIQVDRGDWGSAESSTAILKDTQLEAMWVRALGEVAYLAEAMGDAALVTEAEALRDQAIRSIEADFWNEDAGYYVWGTDREGRVVNSLVPHHAVGFWLGDFRTDRVRRALRTLAASTFQTDWGVRSLALTDPRFDESSYQSGSVWPVWNAGVVISDYREGWSERAYGNWQAMVQARALGSEGAMPEVLRGDRFELLPGGVPHQMFSEIAVVNGFYEGLLGLEVDVPERRIRLAPRLPAAWDRLAVERIPFGAESFDLEIERKLDQWSLRINGTWTQPVTLELRPELVMGARIQSVEDSLGSPYFQVRPMARQTQVRLERLVQGEAYALEIQHTGGVGFEVVRPDLEPGAPSRQVRLLDYGNRGAGWEAELEGRPGATYRFRFHGRAPPVAVEGGVIEVRDGTSFDLVSSAPSDRVAKEAGYVGYQVRMRWQDRGDRQDLLASREGEARIQTTEGWRERVTRIREDMEAVMGPLPGRERRADLAVRYQGRVDMGSYVRQLITFQTEPGSRMLAYLLIPKACLAGERKTQGILCLHPTDHKLGHRVVVGLGGKPGRNYAQELAERGYVTVAPGYPLLANYQPNLKALGYSSGTMKAIWDNTRILDFLETLPYVEPGNFGAIGHSLGGHNAIYTAVFDERIRVVATSCAFDSYLDYMKGDIRGWTSERYLPRLLEYELAEIPFDFYELVGALAPRGLFVSAPLGDSNFGWESVDRIMKAARPVYQLFEAEGHLECHHPDSGHDFPKAMREAAYAFLARHLDAGSAQ